MLLRTKVSRKKPLEKSVQINFGEETIEIRPIPHDQSARFLGVWLNAFNNNQHVEQQIKNEIKAIIKNISCRKGITDKMMIYLFNALIIPILEYRSQLYVIKETKLDKLMAPFRIFIKNKLKFTKTAPNAILETNFIYNLNNLIANQQQAKITNFILQINDTDILGKIMEIRFLNIQQRLCLENHPLYSIDEKLITNIKRVKNFGFRYHFILNNIKLLIENNFKIERNDIISTKYSIEGGPTVIRNLISNDTYIKSFEMLQGNNLIFIDQITTLDHKYLLSVEELELKKYIKLTGKKKNFTKTRKTLRPCY